MIKAGGFQRKSKPSSDIPSSSLADMAFLLLIFFMVTTVFRKHNPPEVVYPEAAATERLDTPRKDILHVYVTRDGGIFINDFPLETEQVAAMVAPLYEQSDRRMVISLRADRDVPYYNIDGITKQLQQSGAVRVAFYTDLEQRVTRARR